MTTDQTRNVDHHIDQYSCNVPSLLTLRSPKLVAFLLVRCALHVNIDSIVMIHIVDLVVGLRRGGRRIEGRTACNAASDGS